MHRPSFAIAHPLPVSNIPCQSHMQTVIRGRGWALCFISWRALARALMYVRARARARASGVVACGRLRGTITPTRLVSVDVECAPTSRFDYEE
eukprot:scaffold51111_cov37-Tisochrysis_lutea.AAC.3